MANIKEVIASLSETDKDQLKQYAENVKTIKKEMANILKKGRKQVQETGGNMSTGLVLSDEEE